MLASVKFLWIAVFFLMTAWALPGASAASAFGEPSKVAQTSRLLYRRFMIGGAQAARNVTELSGALQDAIRRYGRLKICAASNARFVAESGNPAPAASPASARIFQWRPFLAPFHSVVLHYPIGFLTLAFILELYGWWRPSRELRQITTLVILLSLISGILAATLGLMRAGSGGYDGRSLALHRVFGLAIPLLTLLTLFLQVRWRRGRENNRVVQTGYRTCLILSLVALVIGGHLGGNLTHGAKYLVQNAPQFVKALLEEDESGETEQETTLNADQKLFVETIQPIFEAKCIACHGPEKQKGAYRLDQTAIAFKGGESGLEAIRPKDPLHSELVRRMLLPGDHDEAMPPEGKPCLSAEEILQLVRWIQNGAPFVEKFQSGKLGLTWTLENRSRDGVRLWSQPQRESGASSNGPPPGDAHKTAPGSN
ncbi:MAG: hypothetical protein HYY23_08630 [Verrucomicrobia bacterium]|nr:hypothetical protein [Verrucomicrobiota bacterium]